MEEASSPPNNCPIPWQRSFPFQQPSPFCHPERTRISYVAALTGATYVVLLKENHMQLFEAATLDRKSGEAEGSAVRRSGAPNLPFYNHFPLVILERSPSQDDVFVVHWRCKKPASSLISIVCKTS
jgi:hypothetical protein